MVPVYGKDFLIGGAAVKKGIAYVLLLVFLFFLAGCENREQDIDSDGVGIEMTLQTVTSTSATIVFTLHSYTEDDEVMTGAVFWLEKEENGSWERVSAITDNIVWYADTYRIKANVETEILADWSHLYGEVGPGKYRIGKELLWEREPRHSSWYTYYAEFEVVNIAC